MNHFNIEQFIDQHYDKQLYTLASYSNSYSNSSISFRLLAPKYLTGKLAYVPIFNASKDIENSSEIDSPENVVPAPIINEPKVLPAKNKKTDAISKNHDIDYSPQLKPIFENKFILNEFISSFVSVLQSTSSCYMSYLLDNNELGRIIYNFAQINCKNNRNAEEYLMELLSTIHVFREHPRVDLFCQFLASVIN